MKTTRIFAVALTLAVAGALASPSPSAAVCDNGVTFDGLAAATEYSAATGFQPGDVLFVEDGITVTARRFAFPGGGSGYGAATITNSIGAPVNFDRRRICRENNINLSFDLTGLGIVVTRVTFHWLDQGGFENLRVNGGPLYIGELDAAPAAIAPGIAYGDMEVPVPGGEKGESTLIGNVRSFTVGGQEFAIDSICVEGFVPMTPAELKLLTDDPDKAAVATEGSTWGTVKALYR
jgi:hypothetical protein